MHDGVRDIRIATRTRLVRFILFRIIIDFFGLRFLIRLSVLVLRSLRVFAVLLLTARHQCSLFQNLLASPSYRIEQRMVVKQHHSRQLSVFRFRFALSFASTVLPSSRIFVQQFQLPLVPFLVRLQLFQSQFEPQTLPLDVSSLLLPVQIQRRVRFLLLMTTTMMLLLLLDVSIDVDASLGRAVKVRLVRARVAKRRPPVNAGG